MTTADIITHVFCLVDDKLRDLRKHSQAKLHPSEVVTIGILYTLKGGHFGPFIAGSSAIISICSLGFPIALDFSVCWQRIKRGARSTRHRSLADPHLQLLAAVERLPLGVGYRPWDA